MLAVSALALAASQAQDFTTLGKNRFYATGRLFFNVSADLNNLPGGSNTGAEYDDGFVRADASGNAGGKTWFWGYTSANQVFGAAPTRELELHSANSPRDGFSEKFDEDPQYGFELGYGRELFRFGSERNPWVIGVDAHFGSAALMLRADRTMSGSVTRRTDRFSLGSVVPPAPPYSGTFEGPGPLITATPSSSTPATATATSRQEAKIDGLFWGMRVGPFVEAPLISRMRLQIGGGFAAVHVDAKLSYTESFSVTGVGGPPPTRIDSRTTSEWLTGFYGEAKLEYWINDSTSVFLGGQYQNLGDMDISARNRTGKIDFGQSIAVTLGLGYAF